MSSAGKADKNVMIPQAEKKPTKTSHKKNPEKGRIEQVKKKEHPIATATNPTDKHTSEY